MTRGEFSDLFVLLATQLRQTDADEATVHGYYDALKDIEPEFLAAAAKELARSAEWFPKTSEWRAAAAKVERERIEEQRAMLRKLTTPLCSACDDTGYEMVDGRARRCACSTLRRLEVLGRRPQPALPEAREPDPTAATRVQEMVKRLIVNKERVNEHQCERDTTAGGPAKGAAPGAEGDDSGGRHHA